ncbi:MAG: antitoxin [Sporichthyaceae bacterium]
MSFLKNAAAKAEKLVAGNRGKIDKGLAKAGELADKKTKGKHHDKIGKGLGAVSKGLDKVGRKNPPQY